MGAKLSDYYKPTPANMRKLGDALMGLASTASVYSIVTDHDGLAIAMVIAGSVGKFLTNFFTAKPKNEVE